MSSFFDEDSDLTGWTNDGLGIAQADQEVEAAPEEGTPALEVVAEETPAVEVDTVEEQKDERPRDDKGRFAKDKTPEEILAEKEENLAEKYKTDEDLRQAHLNLQKLYGDQTREVSDLRRVLEERFAGLEQAVNRPQAPSSWDDLIEENPAQAVQLAYQNGDEFQLRRAAQAWEEISPGAPAVWAENVRLRAEMEAKFAALEQRTQPVVEQSEDQARARAYLNVKAKFPDIEQYIDQMQQVSTRFPTLVTAIETGTQQEREEGWEALLLATKAGMSDTLRETAQVVARNALDGEQRVRQEAAVASAAAVQTEAPKKSAADLIGDEWDALDKPLADGWNL